MIARRTLILAPLLAAPAIAAAQPRPGPPHDWLFGAWTGGLFPPVDTEGAACFGQPVLVVLRDAVMRVSSLDFAYRQRLIETVAATPDGVEIRLVAVPPQARALPEIGFGCASDPDLLRVSRRGADEIALPGCIEFPALMRRCRTP